MSGRSVLFDEGRNEWRERWRVRASMNRNAKYARRWLRRQMALQYDAPGGNDEFVGRRGEQPRQVIRRQLDAIRAREQQGEKRLELTRANRRLHERKAVRLAVCELDARLKDAPRLTAQHKIFGRLGALAQRQHPR